MTAIEELVQACQWFALCGREAVVLVPHPILGQVPACARCYERSGYEGLVMPICEEALG